MSIFSIKGAGVEEFKEAQAKIESPGLQVRVKKPDIGAKISRCMVIRGEVKSCEPIVIDGTLYGDIITLLMHVDLKQA